MPLEDFRKEFIATVPKFERTPNADSLNFSGNEKTIDKESQNIKNISKQNYQKPSVGTIIGGVIAGATVQGLIEVPHHLAAPQIIKKMKKISNSISTEEITQVEKAISDTLKNSGLEEKGVNIIKATEENSEEITKIMGKEIDKGILKYLPKQVKELVGNIFSSQMSAGQNACYTFASKKIIMPEKELKLAFFHEAGHAMNANLSKIGKILQKLRATTLLTLPISMIALWKTKKAPGEEPKNNLDKTTTFIKDNAGKLTFAACLPMLTEEGLATIKGNKYAKKLLSPELARKVAKTNAFGFSTYMLIATLSSLGIYLGTKVKDSIAHKKLVAENN